jgi:membrane protein implicated in regulation of membrane protease activity
MSQPPSDPLKQRVPPKHLLLVFGLVAYMIAAMAVSQAYSRVLGLTMLAPVVVYMIASFRRLPRELQARIGAKLMEQEQSPFGRFMRLVEIGFWLLIAYALLAWLYQSWQ